MVLEIQDKIYGDEIEAAQPTPYEIKIERWRGVIGMEEYYEVSDMGRVRSLRRQYGVVRDEPLIMRLTSNGDKIASATTYLNGNKKTIRIGREVYRSFVGPIPDGVHVARIDKNRFNNRLSNLLLESPELMPDRIKKSYKTKELKTLRIGRQGEKYRFRITVDGKKIEVGGFNSEVDAVTELEHWIECISNGKQTIDDEPFEKWKHYNRKYEISSHGRVRVVFNKKRGLYRLINKNNGDSVRNIGVISRAVWKTFVGPIPDNHQVRRINPSGPYSLDNMKLLKINRRKI
jgi:hypothetical protein